MLFPSSLQQVFPNNFMQLNGCCPGKVGAFMASDFGPKTQEGWICSLEG